MSEGPAGRDSCGALFLCVPVMGGMEDMRQMWVMGHGCGLWENLGQVWRSRALTVPYVTGGSEADVSLPGICHWRDIGGMVKAIPGQEGFDMACS